MVVLSYSNKERNICTEIKNANDMTNLKQIAQLRFEPKDQTVAARFTKTEAEKIKEFCSKNKIPVSQLIRYSFKQFIPNL
jgi:predicted DNA binding CopG/RHH family protein